MTTSPEILRNSVSVSDLPDELAVIHDAWLEAKGDAFAPTRMSFDLLNVPSRLLRFSSVSDYDASSDTFTFRFFGTGMVEADGIEMTGKSHEEISPIPLQKVVDEICRQIVVDKQANFTEFCFSSPDGESPFTIAGRWPLSEDGENVTGILAVADPDMDLFDLSETLSGMATG
ncbi:MAG: hypothetical protein HOH04_15765 [Rhodospirillaceae bacterium]|nr:hypothetical protein [Rhodospirillaceae bacterium]